MPSQLNEQMVDQITATNAKGLADMNQVPMGLSVQNSVSNQQNVQAYVNANVQNGLTLAQNMTANAVAMSQAITARATRFIFDISAEQAASFTRQLEADIGGRLSNIEAALAGSQIFEKTAATSPPQTGTGGAFGSETGLSQQVALALSNLAAGQAAIVELLRGRGGA